MKAAADVAVSSVTATRSSDSSSASSSSKDIESTPFAKALLNGQAPGSHHGMPGDVTVVAYEASTGALAVGTSRGALKVIGGGGVELLLHDAAQLAGISRIISPLGAE